MSIFIAWFSRAIMFGTVIMFGSMGEIITEKSGISIDTPKDYEDAKKYYEQIQQRSL